jgi:signal transduction histidine kinase
MQPESIVGAFDNWRLLTLAAVALGALAADIQADEAFLITGEVFSKQAQEIIVPLTTNWQARISAMVPEGSFVEEGDVVVEFDGTDAARQLETQRENALTELAKTERDLATVEKELMQAWFQHEKAKVAFELATLNAGIPEGVVSSLNFDEYQLALEQADRALKDAQNQLANKRQDRDARHRQAAMDARKTEIQEQWWDQPAASLVKGLERLKRETVMSFQADSLAADDPLKRLLAHYEVSAVLFVALRRGDEVIGIQTAGHRGRREPFSAAQLRLARELAHVASLALENARLVEELQHANRLKSEFVATMSHELRTPLNVVLGYNELLLDGAVGPLSPQQTDILQRGHRSAQQLLELITATLDLSRLEAGRVEIDLSRVRLATLATEIDTEVQFMRGDKSSVAVHWNVAGNLPILLTDRAKLKLIMKNLLGNALKFTDSGHVTVTARATQGGVEIGVADTGSGIPSEALSTIFEPFRQVDGSSTRRHGGVGLGLYIVRRLVGMLGGTVRVESKEGRGSTFRVWLPQGVESTSAGNGEDVGAAEPVQAETSQGAELA